VRRLHDSWESFKRLVRRLARFWLSHIALPIATLAIGVGARERRWGSEPYGWGDAVFFPALALTILGFATLIVAWQGRYGETRGRRIERLTKSLKETMDAPSLEEYWASRRRARIRPSCSAS
jgi:hypothetical protein